MRLQDWEATIQKIVDECNHEQKRPDNILMAWRVKLEKEPPHLELHHIDEIIREVRNRLGPISR